MKLLAIGSFAFGTLGVFATVYNWNKRSSKENNQLVGAAIFFIVVGAFLWNSGSSEETGYVVSDGSGAPLQTTPAPVDPEQLKSEAAQVYSDFGKVSAEYEDVKNGVLRTLHELVGGSISNVTAYNSFDSYQDEMLQVLSDANSIEIPKRYEPVKADFFASISRMQTAIKGLRDYLDDSKTSTLAKAQNDIDAANGGMEKVGIMLAEQVLIDGYQIPKH